MPATLPAGTTLDVSFTLRLPADASEEEVMAWLRFEFGATGRLRGSNALMGFALRDGRGRDVRVEAARRTERETVA